MISNLIRGGGIILENGDILFRGGYSIEVGQGQGGKKGSKNRGKVVTSFMDGPLF